MAITRDGRSKSARGERNGRLEQKNIMAMLPNGCGEKCMARYESGNDIFDAKHEINAYHMVSSH